MKKGAANIKRSSLETHATLKINNNNFREVTRLVCRMPCSGQAQCTSRRDFAPFSSSTHRVFHGERVGNNDHEGLGDGCEVRSAKTRHNTNCIQQGNIDRAQGCCLWSPVCRPREKLARSLTSLAPALTLTTPCLCSSLLTSRQVAQ